MLQLRVSEKAIQIWRNLPLSFDILGKIKILWEDHKIWKKNPPCFEIYSVHIKVAFSEYINFKKKLYQSHWQNQNRKCVKLVFYLCKFNRLTQTLSSTVGILTGFKPGLICAGLAGTCGLMAIAGIGGGGSASRVNVELFFLFSQHIY